jgi:hypothetical protein
MYRNSPRERLSLRVQRSNLSFYVSERLLSVKERLLRCARKDRRFWLPVRACQTAGLALQTAERPAGKRYFGAVGNVVAQLRNG